MAIAMISSWSGGTPDVYDALEREMNTPENPPEGLIFHWAGHVDGDWTITDVWESQEHAERFNHERVMPAMEKIDQSLDPRPPEKMTVVELHNFQAGPAS